MILARHGSKGIGGAQTFSQSEETERVVFFTHPQKWIKGGLLDRHDDFSIELTVLQRWNDSKMSMIAYRVD